MLLVAASTTALRAHSSDGYALRLVDTALLPPRAEAVRRWNESNPYFFSSGAVQVEEHDYVLRQHVMSTLVPDFGDAEVVRFGPACGTAVEGFSNGFDGDCGDDYTTVGRPEHAPCNHTEGSTPPNVSCKLSPALSWHIENPPDHSAFRAC